MHKEAAKQMTGPAPRILMAGPGREVKGGVSAVVNTWYSLGLDRRISLTYLPTMEDGGKLKKTMVFARALLSFDALMRRNDLLHVHLSPRASFSRKAILVTRAHRMGKKILIHQHGGSFQDFYHLESGEGKRAHIREIFAMADRVIVLSEEWRDFFADGICDPAKLVVLYNGVVPPVAPKADYGDHRVLYLGKLNRMKGSYDLLDAVPAVLRAVPDAIFFLCGDGETEQCARIVREKGVAEHIRFPGWIDEQEREKLFSSCSVFVLPSHMEGMPMSLLEAMSHGLAPIATSVGGIPAIIADSENGLLVTPGDPGMLAGQLTRILSDEQERSRLGRAAAETVKARFDAGKGMEQLLSIYREILAD